MIINSKALTKVVKALEGEKITIEYISFLIQKEDTIHAYKLLSDLIELLEQQKTIIETNIEK